MSDPAPTPTALWLRSPRGPFEVAPASQPAPAAGELVVRVRAVAVNPVDAMLGVSRRVVVPWVRYPTVLGSDIAGEVVAVGPDVTSFSVGDRVVAMAAGQERPRNRANEGGFQELVTVLARVTALLPDRLPFTDAVVLPLGLTTAAAGLYEADQLALPLPSVDGAQRAGVVLVWGASTSVGCNAVQLARASGYAVVATAGRKNHDMVRSLGAEAVVDYRDADAVEKVLAAVGDRALVGSLAIGRDALGRVLRVARHAAGTRAVASVYPDPLTKARRVTARLRGVRLTTIWGGTPVVSPVGPAIYGAFLPAALAAGTFVPAPAARITGHGLDAIPGALQTLRAGVSGSKVVVTLGE